MKKCIFGAMLLIALTTAAPAASAQIVEERETSTQQNTNLEWINLGNTSVNCAFENLSGVTWQEDTGVVYMKEGAPKKNGKKSRPSYQVEIKGIKYPAEPFRMRRWRYRVKAVDGNYYYFNVPDKLEPSAE